MTEKFVFVSASNSLRKYRSLRAHSRQSMRRMSSPGMYARCSAKSVDAPRCGDLCRPLMNPSTTVLREQLEIPDPRENARIEERGAVAAARQTSSVYIPDFGTGTAASSFSIT